MTDNPPTRININKTENRITFKIKIGYYLQTLSSQTSKLFGNTKNKITIDENGKNLSHLEITEVALVHCNFVNNEYQYNIGVLFTFPNKLLDQLSDISPKHFLS